MLAFFFPLVLYLLGLLPAPYLKRHVPLPFFAGTAFAWGALIWIVSAVVILWLPVTYTPGAMMIVIVAAASVLTLRFRRYLQAPTVSEWLLLLTSFLAFSLVIAIISLLNLTKATSDSLIQLLLASQLGLNALTDTALQEFGFWGPALAILHSPASWFGLGYFPGLQAAFGVTLLAGFFYTARRGLSHLPRPPAHPSLVALLATFLLSSSAFLLIQFFQIHNNILAATYLLLGVSCLWLAQQETSPAFLWLGVLALLGFSLSRTETIMFAIMFMTLALSMTAVSYRVWALALSPFTAFLLGWNLWILLLVQPDTHILTASRILLIVVILSGFYLLALSINYSQAVRLHLAPRLHQLLFLCLGLSLGGMFILKGQTLAHNAYTFLLNLLLRGWIWWGIIWWIVVGGLLGLHWTHSLPGERLLVGGVLGFVLLMLAVSYFHSFRFGWGDSANRAFIHLLPVALYYLTLRWGPLLLPGRSVVS